MKDLLTLNLDECLQFPRTFTDDDGQSRIFVLQTSLFPDLPPTIYFGLEAEDIVGLPANLKELLVWRLSTITPNVIREMVKKSGFTLISRTSKSDKWLGTWCKHKKCHEFDSIRFGQKVNHFPGSFHFGRKDKLWINLRTMAAIRSDPSFIEFHPRTYILPLELRRLKKFWTSEENSSDPRLWICKPPASARGNGIKVIQHLKDIPPITRSKLISITKSQLIVQEYIKNPYLVNGTKFDLRLYVLITSFAPLRLYLFEDGLVRFATQPYSADGDRLDEEYVHLTNYSINKKSSSYESNEDVHSREGHKWTLKTFWKYLSSLKVINVPALQAQIEEMMLRTVFSSRRPVNKLIKKHLDSRYTSFELLGFDVMLDEHLKPWLLEVNVSPSLRSESWLDTQVKSQLIKDTFNLVGFRLPSNQDDVGCSLAVNRKFHSYSLSAAEKEKQGHYGATVQLDDLEMLHNLTGDDVRVLMETEDELRRAGKFKRLFPSIERMECLNYVQECAYYEKLTMAWEKKFELQPTRLEAVKCLQAMCEEATRGGTE